MKKIFTFIIVFCLALSSLAIANDDSFTKATATHAYGEMLDNEVTFAADDSREATGGQAQIGYTTGALNSNAIRHLFYDIIHSTSMVNKITREIFLEKISVGSLTDGEPFQDVICKFKVENNTRDGFLVGWFNLDNVNAGAGTAVNYALIPEKRDDGESEIPYSLSFNWESDSGTRVLSAAAGPLNKITEGVGAYTDFVRIATLAGVDGNGDRAKVERDFVVILDGSAGSEYSITEPTSGDITVQINFENASLLKFAGKYNTTNRIAFIDL